MKARLAYQHFINYVENRESAGLEKVVRSNQSKKLQHRIKMIEKAGKQVDRVYDKRKRLTKNRDRAAYRPEDVKAFLTDPDSQFMLIESQSIKPAYNAQICVDENEFIIGKGVSNEPTDVN